MRNLSCRLWGMTAALGLVVAVSNAHALPITFYFGGVVDRIDDLGGELNGLVTTSSQSKELGTFSGQYTFDSETPNTGIPASENYGYYVSQLGLTLVVGKMQIEANSFGITVLDYEVGNPGRDVYTVAASNQNVTMPDGFRIGDFGPIHFYYDDRNTFSSNALPLEPPPLSPDEFFSNFLVRATGPNGSIFTIRGTVEYLVPEPNTLWLFAAGALVIKRRFRAID